MLDLKQNYFALFSLPVDFDIDGEMLTRNYRALQQATHPDRFASGTAQEKRLSMQAASYINEAYQVLGSDLKRAAYILSLDGIDIGAETDSKVDPMFLMAQMEYREQLENIEQQADPFIAADALRKAIKTDVGDIIDSIKLQLQGEDFAAARNTVRKWQFLDKLNSELNDVEHQLEDALDAG